ncbi:hypothetical protein PUR34_30415 [Streptomyces sp. JV185]|uniref:hypothetical protein n=1 Tax=Streptomyces sp. JV185 TaxID=858638 RepID=UPI002E78C106|nr:hypothetical protein [Streptomyces sp. JV185]MEE1772365.1 hypothetical protein [Streptomyces sp. JV185]
MKERVRLRLGGGSFTDDPFAQVAIARAASDTDATVLQMDRNLRELSALAPAGREIPTELRLRARRDQVRGTERADAAIDLLFKTAGGNALCRGNPVERAWRDAHASSVHVANNVERALAMYGRGAFGLTVGDNLVRPRRPGRDSPPGAERRPCREGDGERHSPWAWSRPCR